MKLNFKSDKKTVKLKQIGDENVQVGDLVKEKNITNYNYNNNWLLALVLIPLIIIALIFIENDEANDDAISVMNSVEYTSIDSETTFETTNTFIDNMTQKNIITTTTNTSDPHPKTDNIDNQSFKFLLYPITSLMKNVTTVGEWTYFIYDVFDESINYEYPVLYRTKDGQEATLVNEWGACWEYHVVKESVYYLCGTVSHRDHCKLYVTRPDGKTEVMLDDELYRIQIVDEKYIYYVYRHDTMGVGQEGLSLHRMDITGDNRIIVAYPVRGMGFKYNGYYDFEIIDGWAYAGNFRIFINGKANGLEKMQILTDDYETYTDGYIYYATNRLVKAKPDGSEIIGLDEPATYWCEFNGIENDYITYSADHVSYRIKTDGTDKTIN
jgi:hypothetical protein